VTTERNQHRIKTYTNMEWAPQPGWATVRLVGPYAYHSLRRGQIVLHNPSEDYDVPGQDEGGPMVTILAGDGTATVPYLARPSCRVRGCAGTGTHSLAPPEATGETKPCCR
jgi:hypothetical protein